MMNNFKISCLIAIPLVVLCYAWIHVNGYTAKYFASDQMMKNTLNEKVLLKQLSDCSYLLSRELRKNGQLLCEYTNSQIINTGKFKANLYRLN